MSVVAAFAVPHPPLAVPGVGRGRERGIARTTSAYEEVARRVAELAPDTVVVSSPHAALYLDYFHISPGTGARGSFASFGDPADGSFVSYDSELVEGIGRRARAEGIPAGTRGERDASLDWGVLVPLHFIERRYSDFRLVRMGLSGLSPLDHYRLGRIVRDEAERLGRRVVFVASGDLSHKLSEDGPYGFAPEGARFDELVCAALASGDFLALLTVDPSLAERAAECGLRSFQIMAGALDGTTVRSELLSYEGPFGVGYGVASFLPEGEPGADEARRLEGAYLRWRQDEMRARRDAEDAYVRLARASLEQYVRTGRRIGLPAGLPGELLCGRAGAFVSITKNGRLRGCIGTIRPARGSLAEEIVENAVAAGCHDPRFPRVREGELDELAYDVDVLGDPEPVSGRGELDPARYGVIVSAPDGRRGLLLPDLDGVDTVEGQLGIAARKGGIDLDEEGVTIERFEVVRHL